MAKIAKNNNEWESFVYTPKKPSCLRADGTCDYVKLNVLIEQAKAGDKKATMLVFEQYQGLWKKIVSEFQGVFTEQGLDQEDMQQEAFVYLLVSLKCYQSSYQNSFGNLYSNILRANLTEMLRKEYKLVNLNSSMCSLDTTDIDGNLIYDLPVNTESDYFSDYYPQVKRLLTDREFDVAILRYVDGMPIRTISKELGVTSRTIDNIIKSIKSKLTSVNREQ